MLLFSKDHLKMTVPRGLVVKHEIPPANVPDFFEHMRLSRKLVWDRFGQNAKKKRPHSQSFGDSCFDATSLPISALGFLGR